MKNPFNFVSSVLKSQRFVYTLILMFGFIYQLSGQDTLFFENFDSSPGSKPPGWTTELEAGDSKWQFVNGGGTKYPDIPGSRRPPSAYSDTVNALYFFESLEGNQVILVTPPVNIEYGIRPELRFRHVQREGNLGFGPFHDELRVYYKTDFEDPWTEVNKIGEYTDEVYDWTEQVILLPEEAFMPECYIAFKAKTNYGWGVGIDDVAVIETEVQARAVDTIEVYQDNTSILPTGSKYNPILRIDVSVSGNSGTLTMNSLDLTSLNSSDSDIDAYGVKISYNYSNKDFYAATVLDSATFVSGEAQFSSLNLDLPSGHTSLWISYDIKEDAVHNNLADAMLQVGSINIGGSTYPQVAASPAGNRLIREAVFYDDFFTDSGWLLAGDFERDRPRGLGGLSLGNPDPLFAAGDTMVLGNDLTGLGAIPGDYEPNVPKYGNLATSPEFDLFYYNDVKLNFLRWLNVANNDTVSIEMSNDGGGSWNEIWSNDNNVFADGSWKSTTLSLPDGERHSQVQLRFNLGPTTLTDHFSGWNIDNLAITGNYVAYDVGPVALLSPGTGCGHSSSETVSIRVENFGPAATPATIPVRYSFNGGATFTYDNISGSIAFEGQRDFDFTVPIDLSTPGEYDVIIETLLGVDEEPGNNQLDTVLYVDPVHTLPYEQNFEAGNDFWRADGAGSSFEYGNPMGAVIHTAASGVKAWVTDLDGVYPNDEDSYLLGPCFDFTGIDYPVFECKLYLNTADGNDGADLEYSLDNGLSWYRVGNLDDGAAYGWNWYNSDAISALAGGQGWTDTGDPWHTARILLDTTVFRNTPSVKFRFHFASDASVRAEGIGIDDIRIYDAPRDVGVVSIESPIDGCAQEIGDHVAVTIMNYGLDTLMAGETLIVGYDLESEPTVRDTFVLVSNILKGGSFSYEFKEPLEVLSSGTKNIEAFTLLDDDIDFYNEIITNDTTSKSFEVSETPYVFLPPEIYTVRPDTIVLDAYTGDPSVTYLWQDASTDPVFNVTLVADGVYYVTASNLSCNYSDTSRVYRLIADVGVTDILEPVSSCELGATVRPRIEVTNFGTDTLHTGDTVPVRYEIDADGVIEETAVLAAEVLPDSSFEYTFSTASDMSGIQVYTVSAFTELAYDDDLTNDQTQLLAEVYGFTPVDLGADTVIRAFEYTIDAGAGYDSYLWQDASTSQTLLIDTTGEYWVTVQQGSMCENTDTLHVIMLIPDIGIGSLSHPSDACDLTAAEHVEFYIANVGTDTLLIGDSVFITYQINAGPLVHDTLFVDRKVVPEDSIIFSSAGTVDMSSVGTYQFSVDVSYTRDLIPGNNHLDQSIEVYGSPTLSLGADQVVNTKTHTLDAGSGFVSYLWQDGSADQQFVVEFENQTIDSIYSVTVADIHGCTAADDVKISFDLWDLGISSIISPVSACFLTDQEEVRIFIKNYGTHPVADEMINVIFSVDGGFIVTGQYTISGILDPGDSLELLLGTYDFSGMGDHTITAHSAYSQDDDPFNDSIDVIITNYGSPEPELGGVNDTLGTDLPVTLDAGAGYLSYIWNGIAGNQTYEATGFGWYTVEVMSPGGCTGRDSIYLTTNTAVEDRNLPGEFRVYPIPADLYLNIEYRYEETGTLFLDIFDASGRKILVKKFAYVMEIRETIDVSGMARGIYFIRLRSGHRQLLKQIVIQ